MHPTGDYSITDLAEVLSVSRPTVCRTLPAMQTASPPRSHLSCSALSFEPPRPVTAFSPTPRAHATRAYLGGLLLSRLSRAQCQSGGHVPESGSDQTGGLERLGAGAAGDPFRHCAQLGLNA